MERTLLVRVSEEMADELKDLAETRGVSRKSLAIEGSLSSDKVRTSH